MKPAELIAALEETDEPGRALFSEAWFMLAIPGFDRLSKGEHIEAMNRAGIAEFNRMLDAGAWIDAALTLVPDNYEFHFLRGAPQCKHYIFECRAPSEDGWSQGAAVSRGEHDVAGCAILIAALRSFAALAAKEAI